MCIGSEAKCVIGAVQRTFDVAEHRVERQRGQLAQHQHLEHAQRIVRRPPRPCVDRALGASPPASRGTCPTARCSSTPPANLPSFRACAAGYPDQTIPAAERSSGKLRIGHFTSTAAAWGGFANCSAVSRQSGQRIPAHSVSVARIRNPIGRHQVLAIKRPNHLATHGDGHISVSKWMSLSIRAILSLGID